MEDGIQYRCAESFINYTRDKTNELVGIRNNGLDKTQERVNRTIPDYSFYVNESDEVSSALKRNEWEQCQKCALNLGTTIKQIDRIGFLIQEEMVIRYDLSLLGGYSFDELEWKEKIENTLGKKCNTFNFDNKPTLSHEELIREIMIRFENNAIGIKDTNLQDYYFTSKDRKKVIKLLMSIINEEKEQDIEQYYRDLEVIEQVIIEEKSKESTVGMICQMCRKYRMPNEYCELFHLIEQELISSNRREKFIDIDIGINDKFNLMLQYLLESKIYSNNIIHSTDHIAKTMILSLILAKNEGLNQRDTVVLLISALLHDNSRNGREDGFEHGESSADNVESILKEGNFPYDIFLLTDEDIQIIKVAIHLHDMNERNIRRYNDSRILYRV